MTGGLTVATPCRDVSIPYHTVSIPCRTVSMPRRIQYRVRGMSLLLGHHRILEAAEAALVMMVL